MDLKDIVATNLRKIRHAKGVTQEELSDRSGLSPRHIGNIETAKTSPTVTALGKIADALGVEASVLVTKGRKGL